MIKLSQIADAIKSKRKYWIVFTGDSITSCEWIHPNWREIVEYVLKVELGKEFGAQDWWIPSWAIRTFNFGYDGSTSKDILKRANEIMSVKTDLAILVIGGNDPFLGVTPREHKQNVLEIIKKFEDVGIKTIFVTDNKPWNENAAKKYLPYIEEDKKGGMVKFVNLFDISDNFPKKKIYTFKFEDDDPNTGAKKGEKDFWHPNQLGNAYIAKVILKEIFGVEFDPEKYWQETLAGEKYPKY